MNILLLTSQYPSDKYPQKDSTWVVPYFAREWAKSGHRVVAIVNSTRFPNCYYSLVKCLKGFFARKYGITGGDLTNKTWSCGFSFEDEGVQVFNCPMKKYIPSGRYSAGKLTKQVGVIRSILKQMDFTPDVITGHWLNPQLFLIERLKRVYGCRAAFVFHSDYEQRYLKKFRVSKHKGIDLFACRSRTAAERLQQSLALPYMPFICSSGLSGEVTFCDTLRCDFSRMRIITAGRLIKLKNIDCILQSCAQMPDHCDFSLEIAGSGPESEPLQAMVANLHLGERVSFLGQLSRSALLDRMQNSNVFVLISKEAFGMVYLEAMSQGCLVVATKGSGVDGIIVDGENGFLCELGSSDHLTRIFRRILALSDDQRETIRRHAMETAKRYTNEKAAERYLTAICGGEY